MARIKLGNVGKNGYCQLYSYCFSLFYINCQLSLIHLNTDGVQTKGSQLHNLFESNYIIRLSLSIFFIFFDELAPVFLQTLLMIYSRFYIFCLINFLAVTYILDLTYATGLNSVHAFIVNSMTFVGPGILIHFQGPLF